MLLRLLLTLLTVLCLSSCARQLYQGAELPADKTSHIWFSGENYGKNSGVSLSSMIVDGEELDLFDAGARVLPGSHSVSFDYRYTFEDCRLFFLDECLTRSTSGRCTLSFDTESGKEYKVSVFGHETGASVMVIEADSYRAIANTGCSS